MGRRFEGTIRVVGGSLVVSIDLREAKELRMVNPRYAGVDRTGRPFVVTAASGRQVPDRQDLMSLRSPRADVKSQGGADIVLTAATGVYQSQGQLLDLFSATKTDRFDQARAELLESVEL